MKFTGYADFVQWQRVRFPRTPSRGLALPNTRADRVIRSIAET